MLVGPSSLFSFWGMGQDCCHLVCVVVWEGGSTWEANILDN